MDEGMKEGGVQLTFSRSQLHDEIVPKVTLTAIGHHLVRDVTYLLAGSTNPALRELSVELALSLYLHWDADRFNDAFPQYAKGDLPSTT